MTRPDLHAVLVGHPVAHSRSPQLFAALAKKEAIQNAPVMVKNPLADDKDDTQATVETQLQPPPGRVTDQKAREGEDEGDASEKPTPPAGDGE